MAPWNKDVSPVMSTFAEDMSEILGLGLGGVSRKLSPPNTLSNPHPTPLLSPLPPMPPPHFAYLLEE